MSYPINNSPTVVNPTPSGGSPSGSTPSTPAVITPSSPNTGSTGTHFGITPSSIRFLTVCTLSGIAWPDDLILDLGKSNWFEWCDEITLAALQQGFEPWLDGSLPCPDANTATEANFIWKRNDAALRAFIQGRVSPADAHLIRSLPTACLMFKKLKSRHEQFGAFAQTNLLLKGFQNYFSYETPIHDTLAELRTFYHGITAMGQLKNDVIFAVLLLNAMTKHFGPLQQKIIHTMSSAPNFTAENIATRMMEEDAFIGKTSQWQR